LFKRFSRCKLFDNRNIATQTPGLPLDSDEEIGSEASRKFFEAEARRSDAVFVLEPSFGPAACSRRHAKELAKPN